MRKIILFSILCLFLAACQQSVEHSNHEAAHEHSETAEKDSPQGNDMIVDFRTEPAAVVAGEAAKLVFSIKDLQGASVKELEIVHEKPIHLIAVSEDLSEFSHIHPEMQPDGTWAASFTFPHGGKYRLYADFTPKGGTQSVRDFPVQVSGGLSAQKELKADEKLEKTVDNSRVVMDSGDLESNKETMLNFAVYDAGTDNLASGIEKYLGESAHFVIISQDLKNFVHAHPMSMDGVKSQDPKMASAPANSRFSAHVTFPAEGIYKIFVEFKRGGKVSVAPFVVSVKKGNSDKIMETARIPDGAYKITVSKDGFAPGEVAIDRNNFQKLAFLRVDSENCADEIVFKDLNIRKKLPVGEVVVVDLPKDKTGEISFACGMDMLRGKVVIQ